jgi:hypothetical protein
MPRPALSYHVADLNVRGELMSEQEYTYAQIERVSGASMLIASFASNLWRAPDGFDMPVNEQGSVVARWRASSEASGILTLRCDEALASLSLLASGVNADADRITLEAFQRHLLRELRDTQTEPAFALLELAHRPLVATINFRSPAAQADQLLVALGDRCFGAAYFRYLKLA